MARMNPEPSSALAPIDPHSVAAASDWQALISATEQAVRDAAAQVVELAAPACVDAFYLSLQSHPDARALLSSEMVNSKLRNSLQRWLLELFAPGERDMQGLLRVQGHVGKVHARIRVPIHVVLHGARVLKRELALHAGDHGALPLNLASSVRQYMYVMIDMAIEAMSRAFSMDMQEAAETDGIYQAVSISQDMALERETQRAALLEWSQRLLFDLVRGMPPSAGRVSASAFGMWLRHKGSLMFRGQPNLANVETLIVRIDKDILPALVDSRLGANSAALQELNAALGDMGYLLDGMFAALESLEGGRDPLTRTLNRRFLPTIMGREISVAVRAGTPLSLLMVDVDHFKSVNDRGGHAAGDAVLRHVAEVLLQCTRNSDFVFRQGGEEFLIALVESPLARAMEVAERIRRRIAETPFSLLKEGDLRVTVSIGVAEFAGHPDYAVLLDAADKALYRAKSAGRNRCEAASQ